MDGKQDKEFDNVFSCSICYIESKDKVTLECRHELCIKCFIEMNSLLDENHLSAICVESNTNGRIILSKIR